MEREPFQVLVLPFRIVGNHRREYAVFRRVDDFQWQGVAGGGEDGESPVESARRELFEETGLAAGFDVFPLDCHDTVPARFFVASAGWPPGTYVVKQHFFAVDSHDREIRLSEEHVEFVWLPFPQAHRLLRYDSNRTALWELEERLRVGDLKPAAQ